MKNKDVPAYASGGNIYIRSDIPDRILDQVVPHEVSHVMKQVGYQPYLDFVRSVPDRIDFSTDKARDLLEGTAQHVGIDPFNATQKQLDSLYDEIVAMISSVAVSGQDSLILNELNEVFYDYESFKAELLDIHQKFKEWRGTGAPEATSGEDGEWMELPRQGEPQSEPHSGTVSEGEPVGLTVRQRLTLDEIRYAGHSIKQVGMALQKMGPEATRAVIADGLRTAPGSDSYNRAQALQRKLNNGESITASELGHLYDTLRREPTRWGKNGTEPAGQTGVEEGELIAKAKGVNISDVKRRERKLETGRGKVIENLIHTQWKVSKRGLEGTQLSPYHKDNYAQNVAKSTVAKYNIIYSLADVDVAVVFETAKTGGRHRGTYNDAIKKKQSALEKSILSHVAQVEEHAEKLKHPDKYDVEWAQKDKRQQDGLLEKWRKDLQRNAEQAGIEIEVWKERFGNDT